MKTGPHKAENPILLENTLSDVDFHTRPRGASNLFFLQILIHLNKH
jgi:hypothetical protein